MPDRQALYEALAAIEHQRWADWQRWMHDQCVPGDAGELTITPDLVKRWERQIATPYADLPETEKASDRAQVDRYWHLIEPLIFPGGVEEQIARARDEMAGLSGGEEDVR